MKTDLAPKLLYIYYLLAIGMGLLIVSIIHQNSMDTALHSDNYVPFMTTTILWCMFFLLAIFILSKCRYLKGTSTGDSGMKVGNLLRHSHVTADKVKIEKKNLFNLFKVKIDEKRYYIFTSDRIIINYKTLNR